MYSKVVMKPIYRLSSDYFSLGPLSFPTYIYKRTWNCLFGELQIVAPFANDMSMVLYGPSYTNRQEPSK